MSSWPDQLMPSATWAAAASVPGEAQRPPDRLPRISIASSIPTRRFRNSFPGQMRIQRSLAASQSSTALPEPHIPVGWPRGRRCPGSLPNSRTGTPFLIYRLLTCLGYKGFTTTPRDHEGAEILLQGRSLFFFRPCLG